MFDLILLYVAKVTAILLAFITIAEKAQNMAYKKQEKRSNVSARLPTKNANVRNANQIII